MKIDNALFDDPHPNPNHIPGLTYDPVNRTVTIPTLEGVMTGNLGDWLIKGMEGEYYPCKDSIFQKKYMPLIMTKRLPLSIISPLKVLPNEAQLSIIELCTIAHNSGFWLIGGFIPFKVLEDGKLLEEDMDRDYGSFANVGPGNETKVPELLKELAKNIAFDFVAEKITEESLETVKVNPQKAN